MPEYILSRSRRKTIAVYVRDGAVEVRAPLWAPKSEIDSFVASKSDWIAKRLAATAEQAERREAFMLDYGSTVAYRGMQVPIVTKDGRYIGFDGSGFFMPPGLSHQQIKDACIKIYRLLAKRHLCERCRAWAWQMGLEPPAVRITKAKTRWGSCSLSATAGSRPTARLSFSWRLMMADDEAIEYVLVHELAHISEMSHSKRFWKIVSTFVPDYKEQRRRLKVLHKRLVNEDWD
jgi:predicted metal-dependent hydrolase